MRRPYAPILGWGGFWLMVDEAHIATVASHPDCRGCGLGQWLMLALMDAAQARGALTVTLEVRAGNAPAIKLYDKLGFGIAGERVAYYRDGETALIMTTPRLDDPALQARLAGARQDALSKLEHCFGVLDKLGETRFLGETWFLISSVARRHHLTEAPLRIIPLGGFGEIGKNMMALECGDDILVIDAGLMFPENDMLGIDLVYPDITYLTSRADRVQAVVLTHGHEDHIGALSYLLRYLDAPVYATALTRGLAEVKLKEAGLLADSELHTITADDRLTFGCFTVEFFHICHSIPDAIGVVVHTPIGDVVHATDFKFDPHPVDGKLTDIERLRAFGDRGVLLLMSDSTNADTPGFTPSEQSINGALEQIIVSAPGRIILATFASNISRVQQVYDLAKRHGRRVGVIGRSMINNVRMAINLGFLTITHDELLSTSEMNGLPPEKVVIVCTGSQGEPSAVLARLATNEHAQLQIMPSDTVVLSATPIPGNEELVNRIIDDLFRLGADVIYSDLADVHVSGHGSQEDLKLMLSLTRPKFFVPMHGEYRHLVLHRAPRPRDGRAAAEHGDRGKRPDHRSLARAPSDRRGDRQRARAGRRPERRRDRRSRVARPQAPGQRRLPGGHGRHRPRHRRSGRRARDPHPGLRLRRRGR